MPATRKSCDYCRKEFWATRSDSLYCSQKCLQANKRENRKFETPILPDVPVPGVTFNRFRRKWELRVKLYGEWKYVGASKNLEEVLKLKEEF